MITRQHCRISGGKLETLLNLGDFYVSDFVKIPKDSKYAEKCPLELTICEDSQLVQLRHTASFDKMYRQYWYNSGTNVTMKAALKDIVKQATKHVYKLFDGDVVLDIGCNDGELLSYYPENVVKIGFDPANNMYEKSSKHADKVFANFFNADEYFSYTNKQAQIITAIAMFYDLEEPHKFIREIDKVLAPDGIFIIQMTDLYNMIKVNAIDNICHEHLEYYSLKSLDFLLKQYDLEICDISYNDINGGSIRLYIQHCKNVTYSYQNVNKAMNKEEKLKLYEPETLINFVNKAKEIKERLTNFIADVTSKGKSVYVYGASTKGNTLLQYCGLNDKLITAALERNPDKFGLYTVGTNIQIISEEEGRKRKPDYMLVLPWHFKKEFIKRELEYLKSGGKLIFPMPEFEVI